MFAGEPNSSTFSPCSAKISTTMIMTGALNMIPHLRPGHLTLISAAGVMASCRAVCVCCWESAGTGGCELRGAPYYVLFLNIFNPRDQILVRVVTGNEIVFF